MKLIEIHDAPRGRRTQSPLRVTPRQAEVIELRRRLTRSDVAMVLGVSENTVKTLQARAIASLGAESLTDAYALLKEAA